VESHVTQGKLLVVGAVIKPHGIRGELSVASYALFPSFFAPGAVFGLRSAGAGSPVRWVKALACRPHQDQFLVTVEGVGDRDAAERLRGMKVVVEASALPELASGEVYLHEIAGFDVFLPDGTTVGILTEFLDVPGQDVWVIQSPEGKEILFPAHGGSVVEIDVKARRIVIDPPPGLLEL